MRDGEMESPSPAKVEVIKQAINQMMEEVGIREGNGNYSSSDGSFLAIHDGDDVEGRRTLLSKLMSQLETLKAEENEPPCPEVPKSDSTTDAEVTKVNSNESRFKEDEEERILKELKKVKRQNLITHCLLSAMIILTIAWQVSEVSIILKVKDGVNHPFRSIGSFFKGMLRAPKVNGNEEETDASKLIEASPLHDLKTLDLPHIDLPKIDLGYEDQD